MINCGGFTLLKNPKTQMKITLEKLIPHPLVENYKHDSDLWLKEKIEFDRGGINLISSQSGRGKTSLLSILYGIRKDYNGRVFFDDEDIAFFDRNKWVDLRRNKIAMVFQGLELFDMLSVSENIEIKNRLGARYSEELIMDMARRLDIAQLWDKKVGKISFGQKQRVAIIRALCQAFEVLLLDEPFSHLDEENSAKAFDLIKEKADENKAAIILTSLNDSSLAQNTKTFEI